MSNLVAAPMRFQSILFRCSESIVDFDTLEVPGFFTDLNLDQVVESITAGRGEYNLKPFFYAPLHDITEVNYRHEVLRDLEKKKVLGSIVSFAEKMRDMRKHLEQEKKAYYRYQKERWFLDAVSIYCEAVNSLIDELTLLNVQSQGFISLSEYLREYIDSDGFRTLAAETPALLGDLNGIRYSVHIKGNRVRVSKYGGEPDYSEDVLKTFEKFKQMEVKDYSVKFAYWTDMNHVEAQILDLVAKLYPDIFQRLDTYYTTNQQYLDKTIRLFDREVQFYISYVEFVNTLEEHGLKFCYPSVDSYSKEVYAYESFDIALAGKITQDRSSVVCNDFYLKDPERIFVVTGPNQGGKTTFARMFGQLHYLASLGCPVPGREAQLFLPDMLFTHFEKEEDLTTLMGKLEEELTRIRAILDHATSNSILIMNESFTSTALSDALLLGKEVIERVMILDMLCVYVTFIDELSSLSEKTVSMSSTIVPNNPAVRTYKIIRKPADGLAYAAAIAEKYGLGYESLRRRIVR
jgi:DNA mismatch repair protein MutS